MIHKVIASSDKGKVWNLSNAFNLFYPLLLYLTSPFSLYYVIEIFHVFVLQIASFSFSHILDWKKKTNWTSGVMA